MKPVSYVLSREIWLVLLLPLKLPTLGVADIIVAHYHLLYIFKAGL